MNYFAIHLYANTFKCKAIDNINKKKRHAQTQTEKRIGYDLIHQETKPRHSSKPQFQLVLDHLHEYMSNLILRLVIPMFSQFILIRDQIFLFSTFSILFFTF